MKQLLIIGLGSGIGGMLRYGVFLLWHSKEPNAFPWATLLVNLLGSFLIGGIFALAAKENISNETRLFLATGILGGFTTFSAFSYECLEMFRHEQWIMGLLYISSSILGGIILAFLGYLLAK